MFSISYMVSLFFKSAPCCGAVGLLMREELGSSKHPCLSLSLRRRDSREMELVSEKRLDFYKIMCINFRRFIQKGCFV